MVVPPNKNDVREAMASFSRYHNPELREFLLRCNLRVGGLREDREKRIYDHLEDGSVPLERAFDYIDELKETGEQQLFLFRLQKSRRKHLKDLRDWDYVQKRVATKDDEPRPKGDRPEVQQGLYKPEPRESLFFLTEIAAESPVLAAVYRRAEPRESLFFKWVETRHWTEQREAVGNVVVKQFRERSANFLCIDLATGNAEICIQRLHPNPQKSLREELDLYRKLAGKVVDFDAFVPTTIEPVIRRFLNSTRALVVRWGVRWIDVGNLGGGVDPGYVRGVLKRFGNYSAVSLSADWLFDQGANDPKKVRVKLNGRTNQVDLPKRCLPEEADVILSEIRRVPTGKLHSSDLEAVARVNETRRPILQQIDSKLSVEGKREIELGKVAEEVWYSEEETISTGEEIVRRCPESYRIRYFVSCPDSGNPVSNDQGPVYFERKEDIPLEIGCRHARGAGVATHVTKGRIKVVLLAGPPPKVLQLLPRIGDALEEKVGKSHIGNVIRALSFILFTVLYVPLVWATAWLFLRLTDRFPRGTLIIHLTFFLVLVLEAGIVVSVLGKPLTDSARDLLISLASLFERRRGGIGSEVLDTVVHRAVKSSKAGKKEEPEGIGVVGNAQEK
ncbi:MAG: hypothetical protein ACYTEL_18530 [Planctomycetota bacterium]|jgi:hypothetical protein